MRRLVAGLAGAVALLGCAGLWLVWKASSSAIHPAPGQMPWSVKDWSGLSPREVTVESETGVSLAGRFFAGDDRATVVISHGYGGNQDEMLPVVDALHRAGFSVFTYDLRGSGRSQGEITFGTLEQRDLRSVVDFVAQLPEVDPERIGALGFSMGAATTVLTAAEDPRIKAVVNDSGWADVRSWLKPKLITSPRNRFGTLSLALVEARTETDLDTLKPEQVIADVSPRPILFVHGERDVVVPFSDAERNFAAAREPKELWRVADAAHGDTLLRGGATSSERVVTFFRQALGN
jgi:dipeptidyl aminopeptidase/acylaminoacyl peptidase